MPPRKKIEVADSVSLGTVSVPVDGEARIDRSDLSVQEIEIPKDMYGFNDKATKLAFNEEPITIMIHPTTNPNDEPMVFCCVNGEHPLPGNDWLPRGVAVTIKRKFVGVLAAAKADTFRQPHRDSMDPDMANRLTVNRAMKYPFDVIHDPNPKGVGWLSALRGL